MPVAQIVVFVAFLIELHSAEDHTCSKLGCGHYDRVCSCEDSCWSYNDCCDDFESSCPQEPPRLMIQDFNFLVTTDIHAWIEGRKHEPHLNATLGDVVSTADHLKAILHSQQRDLFLFDNGDINDGTGLSATAEDHVAYLSSLMQLAPYDALNLGNHELYQRNGNGVLPGAACPITALRDSGYIAHWRGKFLTSNTVWIDTQKPVGSRFIVLEGEFGTKLLLFGFLYNMEDHCNAVIVEDVATVVNSSWFNHALVTHAPNVDAIVILAHMDFRDELVFTIAKAIRAHVGERKPMQFLTGHSHRRGWERIDDFASSYEAGCKLNTLGFISFGKTASANRQLQFSVANIDGNTVQFAGVANVSQVNLGTRSGRKLNIAISNTKKQLDLDAKLGCADKKYRSAAALSESDSLWTYYMTSIVPSVLFNGSSHHKQWAVLGNGAFTYDIYKGTFSKDDAYTVSPYADFWFIQHGFLGKDLAKLFAQLNNASSNSPTGRINHDPRRERLGSTWAVPNYVSSGSLESDSVYDIIYCDFDAWSVERLLEIITRRKPEPKLYRPGSNTSSVLEEWFKNEPCESQEFVV